MKAAPGESWASRVWQAAVVLLLTAAAARVVWELLRPLLPSLGALAVLVAVTGLATGRRGS